MAKKPRLICLYGPDGAGKTTQAKLLTLFLSKGMKKRSKMCKYGTYTLPARIFEKIFVDLGYFVWRPNDVCRLQKRIPRYILDRSKFVRLLWCLSNMLGFIVYTVVFIDLPLKMFNKLVIVEDFVPRAIADFYYALHRVPRIILAVLLAIAHKYNTLYVHLDCDYNVIKNRRGVGMEPYDYIAVQKVVYKIFSSVFGSVAINTSQLDILSTYKFINVYFKTSS